jgi:predicted RNA-binding protein (virulence factor B family)
MIEIGKYNELKILRQTSVGLYLGDENGEDVLLPNKYCPESFELEDVIKVFVYLDYAERKIATNITPKILLNEFAFLKVTMMTDVGAFLDWGMEKDLLVPFREQKQKMEEGKWYIVYLDLDKKTGRLFASNKIEKHLQNEVLTVEEKEEVELLVFQKTNLGFSAIINNVHKGLIFKNEIFKELNIGDKLNGFVKKIHEGNKIDISIQPIGYKSYIDKNNELIYRALVDNNGFLPTTDKSSPDEIYLHFGISKKAFKKSIGDLYKQRKITIGPGGIKLI